ncbi:prepilin-type N-terminal cleavage/methylation domain-containing protein [Prosthecobacter sp.]|uniref:type II secretion system protein n=1 Tax=Prosthecobacter sp. TaxID=1965333 RepID=UPI0024877DF9|nr:prepilin-type N-terminal cleavage/methylation domain-containing protein [Prosthecobacter sp.]MDI1314389.1 prepilin-type N-terminal cleavage/methylation domain-containing protein [Prosthecobacter sp.]
MITRSHRQQQAQAFTLLEVVIVLFIVALLLSAVYSITQGTLTLADDIQRHERREARQHALINFCERLLAEVPANAALNVRTTQENGQYLTSVELQNVRSPFDGSQGWIVTMQTEIAAGGSLRLVLICHQPQHEDRACRVSLLEDLTLCEWRVFDPTSKQWTGMWQEQTSAAPTVQMSNAHPPLLELVLAQGMDAPRRQVFWLPPFEPTP